jgi:hypothetical protein
MPRAVASFTGMASAYRHRSRLFHATIRFKPYFESARPHTVSFQPAATERREQEALTPAMRAMLLLGAVRVRGMPAAQEKAAGAAAAPLPASVARVMPAASVVRRAAFQSVQLSESADCYVLPASSHIEPPFHSHSRTCVVQTAPPEERKVSIQKPMSSCMPAPVVFPSCPG